MKGFSFHTDYKCFITHELNQKKGPKGPFSNVIQGYFLACSAASAVTGVKRMAFTLAVDSL